MQRGAARKILLINKRQAAANVEIPGAQGGTIQIVDQKSAGGPIRQEKLATARVTLGGFAVAVVGLPGGQP